MNENEILNNWIRDKRNIYYWGASQHAIGLINTLESSFGSLEPAGIVDSGLGGKNVNFSGQTVRKPAMK